MKICFGLLVNDPRTWEAIDELLMPPNIKLGSDGLPLLDKQGRTIPAEVRARRGCLMEEHVIDMLGHIGTLHEAWEATRDEHPSDALSRRTSLAAKVRMLADEIATDPQARHIRIIDSERFTTTKLIMNGKTPRTLSDILSDIADHIDKRQSHSELYASIRGDKTTRDAREHFVTRKVIQCVYDLTGRPHQAPRSAITLLVNAALGLHGDDEKKPEDLGHIIRDAIK